MIYNAHLPKTGGTSLLMMWREWYGANAVLRDEKPNFNNIPNGIKVVSGHYPYDNKIQTDAQWVTFIRHPIDRLMSFYHYKNARMRKNPHAKEEWWGIMKNMTMEDWLNCDESKNHMVKQFSGKTAQDIATYDDLEKAINNLQSFYFVGLFENYAHDVRTLGSMLGKPEIKIPHLLKSNNDGEFRPHVR
jgi:hypothetical protein